MPDDPARQASQLRACAAIVECHGPAQTRDRLADMLDQLAATYDQHDQEGEPDGAGVREAQDGDLG